MENQTELHEQVAGQWQKYKKMAKIQKVDA